MNALKDNNKNNSNNRTLASIANNRLPNYYKVPEHDQFIDIAHKSQKITTAIYMVTDLVTAGDPLVKTLRETAVEIMQKLFLMTSAPQAKRVHSLSEVAGLIYGLSSYLQVVYHNGKISDMNYELLVSELIALQKRIDVLATKTMPYDRQKKSSQLVDEFTFTDSFFETSFDIQRDNSSQAPFVKDNTPIQKDIDDKPQEAQKDIQKATTHNVANKELKAEESKGQPKAKKASITRPKQSSKAGGAKAQRHEDILKILKQKSDAKIGDVSALIKDCGTKTIQRDLNELVKKGLVVKEGDRRWSTYKLAY